MEKNYPDSEAKIHLETLKAKLKNYRIGKFLAMIAYMDSLLKIHIYLR